VAFNLLLFVADDRTKYVCGNFLVCPTLEDIYGLLSTWKSSGFTCKN